MSVSLCDCLCDYECLNESACEYVLVCGCV